MKAIFAAAGAALLIAMPAQAKDKPPVFVTSSAVKDKPMVTLEPGQAYIYVRGSGSLSIHLMRDPSADDQAAYDKLRNDALAEMKAKYLKKHKEWEETTKGNAGLPKGDPKYVPPGDEPVEPTAENFEFPAFGLMAGVSIGPQNRFAKGAIGSTYLQAVTPGSYRIYGPMLEGANGIAFGSCFCMGSVRFEAKAGEIVDLGTFVTGLAPSNGGGLVELAPLSFRIEPARADTGVDPRIKGLPIHPAAYRPAGKLPNYFGIAVTRLQPVAGVFRYDRDRIVDLTAAR